MPTSTGYYGFPIPVDNDPADAPHDFLALAQKIEDTLKNGYVMPAGSLTVGSATNSTGQIFNSVKLDGTDVYESAFYTATGGSLVLRLYKGGVEVNRFRLPADGGISVGPTGGTIRPIPFAMFATRQTITVSAATFATLVVTMPAGRFTAPAGTNSYHTFITVGNANFVGYITAGDNSSVTVGIRHVDNVSTTTTTAFNLLSIQMTPTSGPG